MLCVYEKKRGSALACRASCGFLAPAYSSFMYTEYEYREIGDLEHWAPRTFFYLPTTSYFVELYTSDKLSVWLYNEARFARQQEQWKYDHAFHIHTGRESEFRISLIPAEEGCWKECKVRVLRNRLLLSACQKLFRDNAFLIVTYF